MNGTSTEIKIEYKESMLIWEIRELERICDYYAAIGSSRLDSASGKLKLLKERLSK